MLQVKLLGQFDVRRDGTPINIPSRAAQSLLAYLLLTPGTAHRREKLAGLLWPDSTDEHARKNLRHELWRLRKALTSQALRKGVAPYLVVDEISIAFNAESDYWLDVAIVKSRTDQVSANELIETLALYRGELLPGVYDDWAVLERGRIDAIFEQKMARLLELLVEGKRWPETLEWGERWIALGHAPEPAYRALMVAQDALGNRSQVASVYERCVQALHCDLGVDPSERTRSLFEHLSQSNKSLAPFQSHPANLPSPQTVAATNRRNDSVLATASNAHSRSHHLPVPLTSFIGREHELQEVKQRLACTRLLTLIGPGGVGKTRMAIQLAKELASQYPDQAWWVDLAGLSDPDLVPQTIARVLGLREIPNVPAIEMLAQFLCAKQVLLVLDNCEHLVDACARLAESLLVACDSLKILTTSREALGIFGETLWPVPTLSIPDREQPSSLASAVRCESVRLFVERARAVKSDFKATDQNASTLIEICRRLDGIPLAIELAAARVKTLSAHQIAARLDDRFELLTPGSRTAVPRHQTLRATMDWSHDLLSEMERVLFRRLSVFMGGWTLDAAESVCTGERLRPAQVLELLARLVDKSLVIVTQQDQDARYHLLESVREYALEKLDEAGEKERLRLRHSEWFAALAARAEVGLRGAGQLGWLDRLEAEQDNLREAWGYAIECDTHLAVQLASGMLNFWLMRGNAGEGHAWSAALLARTRDWKSAAERAHVLAIAALGHYLHDEVAPARMRLEEALALARGVGDKTETAFVLLWIGRTAFHQGDISTARAYIEEGLAISQELDDPWEIARGTYLLGNVFDIEGKYIEAERQYRSSWARFQGLGDQFSLGFVANALGEQARQREDYERAGRFYEQSIEIFRTLRSRAVLESPAQNLAWVWLHRGEYRKAKALFEAVLNSFREQGDQNSTAYTLTGFVGLFAKTGRPEQAARLLAAVEALFQHLRNGRPLEAQDQKELDRSSAVVRGQLDQAAFEKAYSEGRTMTLEQAVALAIGRPSDAVL